MSDTITLVVPEMVTLSRSYERTVNPKNYVPGFDYESHKVSSFKSRQIPAITTAEEQRKISEELFELAKLEVEISVTELINKLKREAGLSVQPTGEDYKTIADIIFVFETAVTKEEVERASNMVKERKDKFNETQLEYLRHIGRKANVRVLK